MVSLLVTTNSSPAMEMATIGNEGVAGASEVLQMQPAMGLNLIQIPGAAVRVKADDFRTIIAGRPGMQKVIHQHFMRSCGRFCMEQPVTAPLHGRTLRPLAVDDPRSR